MIALLRNLVFKDLALKLFSLALAILAYWTIDLVAIRHETPSSPVLAMGTGVRTLFNLPVLVLSSAADTRGFKVTPETVDVTVQGDSRILGQLESDDIRAEVDLTGVEAASNLSERIKVATPAGVTCISVVPGKARVIFPTSKN
jgi:hypothetical protein